MLDQLKTELADVIAEKNTISEEAKYFKTQVKKITFFKKKKQRK